MARRLTAGNKLVLASHNRGKLAEIADLVLPWGIEMVPAGALGLAEPEETAADFYGNARLKAEAAAAASQLPSLADDSGFCVAALEGRPGVHSARWAGPDKNFAAAMQRIHTDMKGAAQTRAWFVCVLSLAWPDGETASFYGRVEGNVSWPPRGTCGFGYDPIFTPLGGTLTYGEMAPAEKHASSHRARAMAQLARSCL
jgi:XTP/dITP diphosphohydrolase